MQLSPELSTFGVCKVMDLSALCRFAAIRNDERRQCPAPREFIFGPWRAVSVLGVTEILSWGALFYPPVLTVPLIAADHGWSRSFTMGGFSLGLLVGGLCSRYVGATIDRLRRPCGDAGGIADRRRRPRRAGRGAERRALISRLWMVLGVAMAASLYDPAFATLGRIFGAGARSPITTLTLAGGFASTVSWPATQYPDRRGRLARHLSGLCRLARASSLRRCTLSRCRAGALEMPRAAAGARPGTEAGGVSAGARARFYSGRRRLCRLRLRAVGAVGAASRHLQAVRAAGRRRRRHRHAVRSVAGAGAHLRTWLRPAACIRCGSRASPSGFWSWPSCCWRFCRSARSRPRLFAVMFGMANGLLTIARGTVPLALFGPAGYGRLVGRIGGPFLVVQALAPVAVTYVADRASDAGGPGGGGGLCGCGVCLFLDDPQPE